MARSHRFYINTNPTDYASGSWIPVSGVNTFSVSEDSSDVDVSDFDSSGWGSSFVVTRNMTISVEGFQLVDEATKARDSGQLMCDVAGHLFGQDSFRYFKMEAVKTTDRTSPIGHIILLGSFKPGEIGGGMEDANPFSYEIMSQGAPISSGIYGYI